MMEMCAGCYRVGCVGGAGGQWDDRSASASLALADAWLGSEVGWVKVQSAFPGPVGWSAWLSCAADWLTPDASVITAGDAAATSAIANKAMIFDLMSFPIDRTGTIRYESRVLNTRS